MNKERKKALIYLLMLNSSILLFTLVFCTVFKPWELTEGDVEITCFVANRLHIYCPACGGTRALGFLLRFDFVSAFLYYPPLFVGIFLIVFVELLLLKCAAKKELEPLKSHHYYEFILLPISIILFFLIRNILLFSGIDYIGDFIPH